MPTPDAVEIRRLDGPAARAHLNGLAGVLRDCVEGGASVGYMAPFSDEDARAAFEGFVSDAEQGRRLIVAAFDEGEVVGTVQVVLALMPNQPHRGEIAKLMERAEAEALAERKTLLVLDAVTGDPAERLYEGMGWNRVGIVPGFALYPDGRPCSTTYLWKALEPSRP
jgi:hypothetical protein